MGLRTKEQLDKYLSYIAGGGLRNTCVLCDKEPIREFAHWKITNNDFPYDKVADVHHMILPKRHVAEDDLSKEELKELDEIKRNYLHKDYEFIIEASNHEKSIPDHFHLHLIITKE